MPRKARLARSGKNPCAHAERRAACGPHHPSDMTLPLARRKEAPRPWRRPRRGDGGFPRGRSGKSADYADGADFNRRKSAQSADKLPVGRPGGGPASAPFRSASQPADTLSQPAGTVRHTADTLSQPAGTARHTAGLISQPAGAASHVSGSARHTAGGVGLVSGTARHTTESARVARFTENCPVLATSQPPARKAGGTPALYPHRAEAAPLARRASQFVNRT